MNSKNQVVLLTGCLWAVATAIWAGPMAQLQQSAPAVASLSPDPGPSRSVPTADSEEGKKHADEPCFQLPEAYKLVRSIAVKVGGKDWKRFPMSTSLGFLGNLYKNFIVTVFQEVGKRGCVIDTHVKAYADTPAKLRTLVDVAFYIDAYAFKTTTSQTAVEKSAAEACSQGILGGLEHCSRTNQKTCELLDGVFIGGLCGSS